MKAGVDRVITCSGALLDTDGAPVGAPHAITLSLISPDGHASAVYRHKALTRDRGTLDVTWTLAEDDVAGVWTVRAVDVASGIEERTWVRIE